MAEYNGHKNYAYWNVALWLFNDEGLYVLVQQARRKYESKRRASRFLIDRLPDRTPDGVRYTFRNVLAALSD